MIRKSELQRQTFRTSRLLDFASEKELVAQIGHPPPAWPLVLCKELLDNSLDACEESGITPKIVIRVDSVGFTITDNGPGIRPDVITDILDYSKRVSSREAYVAPDRGAQGNALKTVVAMPFVLNSERGHLTIRAHAVRHEITLSVDQIQQSPIIEHEQEMDDRQNGTSITVHLPDSFFLCEESNLEKTDDEEEDEFASSLTSTKRRFLQIVDDFAFLNPHLSLTCDWFGERLLDIQANEPLNDAYFTQNLLPAYVRENSYAENWDIVFDARGHFHEPHTGHSAALGTLDVRRYLSGTPFRNTEYNPDDLYPTHGPGNRFGAILFVEKEGFMPLFKAVKLAERFDLGIMSTKGLSNVAARQLVDRLCGENDIPLLVLRDFDKAGFSIASTLSRDTGRYSFQHPIQVIDLGLRLTDAEEWRLESEAFHTKMRSHAMAANLYRNGATSDEVDFIAHGRKRVELNAFNSADLVAFIERKLAKHGIRKVVPTEDTLERAYRRSLEIEHIKRKFESIKTEATELAESAVVPALKRRVAKVLRENPTLPWDLAIVKIAADELAVS